MREDINRGIHLLVGILSFCFWGACSNDENLPKEPEIRKEYTIAIVLPHSNNQLQNWQRSIDWAIENLNAALENQRQIRLVTQWYDQDKHDMETLFRELAYRDDISAIIGPILSANAHIAAGECSKTDKTLITGTVSSELVMRKYAQKKFLWCLAENDISQCEVLLSRAAQKQAKTVSLLTSDNEYGTTFWDWFSFQAKELGLEVKRMEKYTDADVSEKMQSLMADDVDCLICVAYDQHITRRMNDVRIHTHGRQPFLLFSDAAALTSPDESLEGLEGIVRTYDPGSGFHINYQVRYEMEPQYGSAQYYDAAILAGLGILEADLEGETNINDAICRIVDGEGTAICCNTAENTARIVSQIIDRKYPKVTGGSGSLRFDKTNYTNVLHSVYSHWIIYNGKYLTLEYTTSDDNNRTSSVTASWNWKATDMQNFSETGTFTYPPQTDSYALIIAGSSGWSNYRHQADALEMYQLLKNNGMDDEHILLIAEDDIAWNEMNPFPGNIYTSPGGANVYEAVKVDYRLSGLEFADLYDLLTGGEGEKGLSLESTDNLFIYWCGHGSPTGPLWFESIIPAKEIAAMFNRLSEEKRFRKVFFAIETCFSGQIGLQCQDIPGLLCLTAANELETSKVSRFSTEMNIWMSNSFSDALISQLSAGQEMNVYKLYNTIYNRTMGSHVSVYNASSFDNLYNATIREFLYPLR